MQKITVSKDNQELTFDGWQSVHRELFGSDVPISAKNMTIKLNKEGWSVINIEGTTKKSASKTIPAGLPPCEVLANALMVYTLIFIVMESLSLKYQKPVRNQQDFKYGFLF